MPSSHVDLISHWQIAAPIEQVWTAMADLRRWPLWWRGIGGVRLLQAKVSAAVDSRWRVEIPSRWPFQVAIEIETINAASGEQLRMRTHGWLHGEAIWLFRVEGSDTTITCVWRVEWFGPWARGLALLATPLLRRNHRMLMRAGEAGLRRHLQT